MFRLIRPVALPRYVDAGRVQCPLRGREVDVDLCAGCASLTEIDLQAEPPFLRCRPEPTPLWLLRSWT